MSKVKTIALEHSRMLVLPTVTLCTLALALTTALAVS